MPPEGELNGDLTPEYTPPLAAYAKLSAKKTLDFGIIGFHSFTCTDPPGAHWGNDRTCHELGYVPGSLRGPDRGPLLTACCRSEASLVPT